MLNRKTICALTTALTFIAGCTPATRPGTEVQQNRFSPPPAATVTRTTPQSLAMKEHLARSEQASVASGHMRTDTAPRDARFTRTDLIDNFMAVALFDETNNPNGGARRAEAPLRRWEQPVRFGIYFGEDVPLDQQREDLTNIRGFASQVARATRHPVTVSNTNANFHVLVLNEHERRTWHSQLRRILPDLPVQLVRAILHLPRHKQCQMLAWDPTGSGTFTQAIALVRAEHPNLTRLSCFHEELAQGMGLPNDSPDARPSIFNDDEEFGLLTRHDEYLLRILYDPRLRPGMRAREARPIVENIVSGLNPDRRI